MKLIGVVDVILSLSKDGHAKLMPALATIVA
jgi:hypothetical protein